MHVDEDELALVFVACQDQVQYGALALVLQPAIAYLCNLSMGQVWELLWTLLICIVHGMYNEAAYICNSPQFWTWHDSACRQYGLTALDQQLNLLGGTGFLKLWLVLTV